jgi:hypothetical protein
MAHQRLAHMRNRSQTLSKKWRKGMDIPPEVTDGIKKYHMRISEIITYVALRNSMDVDDDYTSLTTATLSCQDLADKIGIYNAETIRTNVNRLEAKGLVKIQRGGLTNVYTLVGVKPEYFIEGIVRK